MNLLRGEIFNQTFSYYSMMLGIFGIKLIKLTFDSINWKVECPSISIALKLKNDFIHSDTGIILSKMTEGELLF